MNRQIIVQWIVLVAALVIAGLWGGNIISTGYEIYTLDRKMSSIIKPNVQLDLIPQGYRKHLSTYPAKCATSGCEHMRNYALNRGLNLTEEEDLLTISKGHMNFYFTTKETSKGLVLKQVIREKS